SNIFFLLSAVSVGMWGIVFIAHMERYVLVYSESFDLMLPYFVGVNIPLMILFFALTFTQQKLRVTKKALVFIFVPYTALMWGLFFFSSRIIEANLTGIFVLGSFYSFYVLYVVGYALAAFFLLLERYRASAGVFKTVLRSVVWSVGLGYFLIFCMVFLYFFKGGGEFIFMVYVIALVSFLQVGIKKMQYHRWDLKPFFAEVFVSFIALTLVAQMIFDPSAGNIFIDAIVFIFFLTSGYFLIRSVSRESKAKNEIEKLVKDLTDVNEELQVLDKRKSEFVKISAHHLKTPLTVIKGYASMILEGSFGKDMDKEAEEATRKIFDASERLVNIIKDFMDISNIESGKMEYVFEDADVKKLVEGVLEEMKLTIDRSGLDVSFNTDEIDGYMITADSGKLRQVLSNLIDNAIKYTPQGHVHLFLKKERENKKLHLTITDTGVGMSEETINKLFEKFSRADDANKVNTSGSGLGLYVAKEIVKKHEANIWAESPGEGKGSTFHLEFD
ncbi:MAG: ATP-binding protein, partial [Candidatus Pacebacteria bacterium]|nr:ATP-binding protein [Candidatus Paceibacterota bacterium]